MFAVSVLAGCALALPAAGQKQGTGPLPQPVTVVNGPGLPVPVTTQGTTNVAGTVTIGNTPSVSVANTPNVNIANTPSVSISGTPTVALAPGGSTNVTNLLDGQNNPKPLVTLEAAQPYEDSCQFSINGGSDGFCDFKVIPPDKRLIIEEFDATFYMSSGVKPWLLAFGNGTSIAHYFASTAMGSFAGWDYFVTHQPTRLNVGPGMTPRCSVEISANANGGGLCDLSGFLVDVP
jgi:hypothetical protein